MQKVEAQRQQIPDQRVQRRQSDHAIGPPEGKTAQLAAMANASPQASKLAQFAAMTENSSRSQTQSQTTDAIHRGVRMTAQRQRAAQLDAANVKRSGASLAVQREAKADTVEAVTEKADQAQQVSAEQQAAAPSGNAVEVNPKANISPEERRTLAEKGGLVVNNVSATGSVASGIKDMVSKFSDTSKITEGASITQSVGGILSGIGAGIVNTISMLAKPLFDAIAAFAGMKTKWSQWGAYSDAAKDGVAEAAYGEKKAKHGFMSKVTDFSLAILNFTGNLLLLIPGAQIVGGPMKMFTFIAGLGRTVMNAVLKSLSFFRGDKKEQNACSLLTNAINGDDNNKSAQLVFKLNLSSITGSFFKWMDKIKIAMYKAKHGAKKWWDNSNAATPEIYIEKHKAPSGVKEMQEALRGLFNVGGMDAVLPIKDEIKESMTGLTA